MPDMLFSKSCTGSVCELGAERARELRGKSQAESGDLSKSWRGARKLILPRDSSPCTRTQDTLKRQRAELCPGALLNVQSRQPYRHTKLVTLSSESSFQANQPLFNAMGRHIPEGPCSTTLCKLLLTNGPWPQKHICWLGRELDKCLCDDNTMQCKCHKPGTHLCSESVGGDRLTGRLHERGGIWDELGRRVGSWQGSREIHSQQDKIHGPTFSSLPPRSMQGARAQHGCVPGKDRTPYSSTFLLSKHKSLLVNDPGSGASCSGELSWTVSCEHPLPLGKLKSCIASSSCSRKGSHWSQRACCLATQIEPPGSFSGQSCPSLHKE